MTSTTTTRHSPRRSHSRTKLLASACDVDVLCLTLPPRQRKDDNEGDADGTDDAARSRNGGPQQSVIIRVQLQVYCGCTAAASVADLDNCRIEVLVRGKRVPVSFCSDASAAAAGGAAANAAEPLPTFRLAPVAAASVLSGDGERGAGEDAEVASERALEARGSPLTLLVDLRRCGGPGLLRVELRSSSLSSAGGGRLLAAGSGLLLPSASKAAAREIMRFHRR